MSGLFVRTTTSYCWNDYIRDVEVNQICSTNEENMKSLLYFGQKNS